MAFEPSYNILDKDTHNMVVEAFKSGGIGYTEADGTVHKLSGDYVEGGGGGGYDALIEGASNAYTLVSGNYDEIKTKVTAGHYVDIRVAIAKTLDDAVGADIRVPTFVGYYNGADLEFIIIPLSGTGDINLFWLPDGTVTDTLE